MNKKNAAAGSTSSQGQSQGQGQQKSVWQVEKSSPEGGCTFVCPQLQSFNTSLPDQDFSGTLQASTIVEHRVNIATDLAVTVFLNGEEASVVSVPYLTTVATFGLYGSNYERTLVSSYPISFTRGTAI